MSAIAVPSRRRPTVIFDADDTLWSTEELYDEARQEAAEIVERAGIDPVAWDHLQKEIDVSNLARFGLSPERFPTSSVEAYRQLVGAGAVPSDVTVEREIYRAAATVFTRPARLADRASTVLNQLGDTFPLGLLSKGDPEVQRRRLRTSGLAATFDVVSIVPNKGVAEFRAVLDQLRGDATSSWSVGNSLPSDIEPALQLGMRAIWIDAHVWAHERRAHKVDLDHPRLTVAHRLSEVPGLMHLNTAQVAAR